jgi:hypothetical protein
MSIKRIRTFCITENINVYSWSVTLPTTCPNSDTHTISSVTVIDTADVNEVSVKNLLVDPLQRLQVVNKVSVFDIKSIFGKSQLRDIFTTVGTATITNVIGTDAEYKLSVSSSTDISSLTSAQRGSYVSGTSAEVGLGVRLPATLTGNQTIKWGYTDGNDGFYYKQTSSGLFICILRGGIETSTPRSNWNIDRIDGKGESAINIDLTRGNIYRIVFTWYGYGAIEFSIVGLDITNSQKLFPVHRIQPWFQTSTKTPNLPIRVILENNGTIATTDVYVAGRQFSLYGNPSSNFRYNTCYGYGVSTNSTEFTPMITLRKKATHLSCRVRPVILTIDASVDTMIEVRTGCTVTGGTYGSLVDQSDSETALEMISGATAVSGGTLIWLGILASTLTRINTDFNFDLIENNNLVVMAKTMSVLTGTCTATLRLSEEW